MNFNTQKINQIISRNAILIFAGIVATAAVIGLALRAFKKISPIKSINIHADLQKIAELSGKGNSKFGVYVTANDFKVKESMEAMGKRSNETKNTVHLGVGVGGSLDIAAHRKSNYIIIVDNGTQNKAFIELMSQVMIKGLDLTRQQFVKNLIEGIHNQVFTFGEDVIDRSLQGRIRSQLEEEFSWLGNDESFNHIKQLFLEGRVVPITVDLTDSTSFTKIHKALEEKQLVIDTVYLCNVRFFIGKYQSKEEEKEKERQSFVTSINSVINDKTYVIHCPDILPENTEVKWPPHNQNNTRTQSVTKGEALKKNSVLYFERKSTGKNDVNGEIGGNFKSQLSTALLTVD